MLCPHERPVVGFYFDGYPVPLHLPVGDDPLIQPDGYNVQAFEEKHAARQALLLGIQKHLVQMAKKSRLVWDTDKCKETTKWREKILKTPDIAVPQLEGSYHGCVYLIEYWEYLKGKVNDSMFGGSVDREDKLVTSSLMGIPFDQRTGWQEFMFSSRNGDVEKSREFLHNIYDERISRLRILADERRQIEDHQYEMETRYPSFHPDKELRRLKRDLRLLERDLYCMSISTLTSLGIVADEEGNRAPLFGKPAELAEPEEDLTEGIVPESALNEPLPPGVRLVRCSTGELFRSILEPRDLKAPKNASEAYLREWQSFTSGINRPRIRRSRAAEIVEKKQE